MAVECNPNRVYQYDSEHDGKYGYWRCAVCKSDFYAGGRALHAQGCTETNYFNCIYVFGPEERGLNEDTPHAAKKRAVMGA